MTEKTRVDLKAGLLRLFAPTPTRATTPSFVIHRNKLEDMIDSMLLLEDAVGTVSESGGIPTGAVIERGSNADGEYVRWADGTQICWKTLTDLGPVNIALGSVFRSSTIAIGNWAATFSALPTVSITQGKAVGVADGWASHNGGPGTVSGNNATIFCAVTRADTDFSLHVIAVGRWF